MPRNVKYTKEQVQWAVMGATSFSEALRALKRATHSGNFQVLQRKIREWEIDISHFTGSRGGWNKGSQCKGRWGHARTPLEDVLSNKLPSPGSGRLKKRLVEAGLKTDVCEVCGQGPQHNGKDLVLQLDHIDGNRYDNRIENLRVICPNCHTQTETFGNKTRTSGDT